MIQWCAEDVLPCSHEVLHVLLLHRTIWPTMLCIERELVIGAPAVWQCATFSWISHFALTFPLAQKQDIHLGRLKIAFLKVSLCIKIQNKNYVVDLIFIKCENLKACWTFRDIICTSVHPLSSLDITTNVTHCDTTYDLRRIKVTGTTSI